MMAIRSKAMKLYMSGAITMKDFDAIAKICDFRKNKL